MDKYDYRKYIKLKGDDYFSVGMIDDIYVVRFLTGICDVPECYQITKDEFDSFEQYKDDDSYVVKEFKNREVIASGYKSEKGLNFTEKLYSNDWMKRILEAVAFIGLMALFVYGGFLVLEDNLWVAVFLWVLALAFIIWIIWDFRDIYKAFGKKAKNKIMRKFYKIDIFVDESNKILLMPYARSEHGISRNVNHPQKLVWTGKNYSELGEKTIQTLQVSKTHPTIKMSEAVDVYAEATGIKSWVRFAKKHQLVSAKRYDDYEQIYKFEFCKRQKDGGFYNKRGDVVPTRELPPSATAEEIGQAVIAVFTEAGVMKGAEKAQEPLWVWDSFETLSEELRIKYRFPVDCEGLFEYDRIPETYKVFAYELENGDNDEIACFIGFFYDDYSRRSEDEVKGMLEKRYGHLLEYEFKRS